MRPVDQVNCFCDRAGCGRSVSDECGRQELSRWPTKTDRSRRLACNGDVTERLFGVSSVESWHQDRDIFSTPHLCGESFSHECKGRPDMRRSRLAIALLILTLGLPTLVEAQTEISARGANLRLGGRLHTQYWSSSVDGSDSDFFIRRARLIVDADFTDFVTARVQTDFASSRATLLDAYVRLNFSDGFRVSFGQFKRAFDLFELSSSSRSVAHRAGPEPSSRGLAGVTGRRAGCALTAG